MKFGIGLVFFGSVAHKQLAMALRNSLRMDVPQSIFRRCSSNLRSPKTMRAWCQHAYGPNSVMNLEDVPVPVITDPREVLVRVHAASVNPVDVKMRDGYASRTFKALKDLKKVPEFPAVLGRDFSGVVVKTGRLTPRFKVGDEVWGCSPLIGSGSFADYVIGSTDKLTHKPSNLTHVEAASFPHVHATVWVALCSRGGLSPENTYGKRVLIFAGSGGVGTLAIQLLRHWGCYVTSTCSTRNVELLYSLGADEVIDYTKQDVMQTLLEHPRYDVILDNLSGETEAMSLHLMKKWPGKGTNYVTLASPLLSKTDQQGFALGLASAGSSLLRNFVNQQCSGNFYSWGFGIASSGSLQYLKEQIEKGKVLPVIDSVFDFKNIPDAFQQVESGRSRGKNVIRVIRDAAGDET